ncbi:DUF6443 domain-containing protein [Chryseobacterium sp. FH2]|uniref:DUF6443 domain-containing protein n=1 Tax=Chryseobacterium sp. FH2 TaxID=1674291 RepID=UPI00069F6D91|nr:DUF6443 domain-containing protein [Chryseobacterium sp. FH2]
MKKIISLFNILFVAGYSYAQALQATSSENYTYSKTCLDETCTKKAEQVQYFDDLGRPKQVVDIKATPSGKDMATPIQYDEFGRTTKEYFPVPQPGTQNGAIYTDPLSNAPNIFGNEKIFTEKLLENSPLNRVKKVTPPGNDWASHPANITYSANLAGEVKKYTVSTSWQDNATFSTLTENGTYGANQLMKNTVTDGDGNMTAEFKTADGQTVLVRKNDGAQNIDTYYVYNESGQLVVVIPPLASAAPVHQTALDNLCYQYRYDGLGRLVEKKLPGKGWEYFVYDKADRQVLSQDANMKPSGNWLFTRYDKFSRVIYTGIAGIGATYSRKDVQDAADYNAGIGNPLTEERNLTGFNKGGMDIYYGNNAYPTSIIQVLTVNYYDTYPQGTPSRPAQVLGQNTIGDNMEASVNTKNLPTASFVKNMEDDNWTKSYIWYDEKSRAVATYSVNHLGGYTKTESELDFAGMVKQSKTYHKRLNTDTEKVITQTFEYDSGNRLLAHKHQVDNNPVEILAQNEYNELSQIKNKKVGGTFPSSPLQSIDYTYNIQGNLTKINDPANLNGKLFGYEIKYTSPQYTNVGTGKYNGTISEIDWKNANEDVLKRYTYTYDGLNRLKDAVYSEPNSSTPFNNNFNENISYDINGNIKTLKRNAFPVSGNTATLVDDLVYDYVGNRLARIQENALNESGYEGGNHLISYDANGNMTDMLDKGIQSISYNELNLPRQFSISQTNPLGQVSNSTIDYLYSAGGTKLRKNYRNLGMGAIITRMTDYLDGFQYTYNDNGTGGICLECRTENAFEIQAYKGIIDFPVPALAEWKLDFVATAEGFYSFTENRYIYQYKDHLGNTRVSFAKNSEGVLEIKDTNNFYPLGLNHIGSSAASNFGSFYSYKYNGKELQETGMYDYGARFYLPDLGRWGVIDPLAETSRRFSPYHYAMNNPVMFIDPDGRKAVTPIGYAENGAPAGSLWWYYAGGGSSVFGSAENWIGAGTGEGRGSHADGSGFIREPKTFGETQAFRDIMNAAYTPDFSKFDFTKFGLNDLDNNDNNDCPKCPKKAKDGQMYSIGFTGYQYRNGNWVELEPGTSVEYKGKSYFNPSVEPITGDVPIGPAGSFNILKAFKSGLSLFKGGSLTNIGRAVTKHPQYFGFESTEALMKVFRNPNAINKLGADMVKDILRNGVKTTGAGGRYPQGWVTYTLPNGNAASWSIDGVFIGFRGLK